MIHIIDKSQCCGCTACASICAHEAITMQPDALGFLYPVVDTDKCTCCGLCENVCSFSDNYDKSQNLAQPDAYAARHNNMDEVETSRSGAAFIAISDWILQHGGIVYGVGYVDHFHVAHKRAINKEERDEFKGSKYVQSDLTGIFRQVRTDLRDDRIVLFSGTPCQTAGLNAFIGKKLRENLYLIDIVCHGVPSPYLWRDYITYLEKKHGDKICFVNFRDKQEFGWRAHRETFKFINKEGVSFKGGSFTYLFYKHIMFRHSCGSCHYANLKRPSDITIADFWGWEKTNSDINADDKGVSLVLCNTEKGHRLFEAVKKDLKVVPAKLEDCIQPNLQHPTSINPNWKYFEADYKKRGFEYVYKKYGHKKMKDRFVILIRKMKISIKNICKR